MVQPGNMGSTVLLGHATTLPHAFTAGTFYDPASGAWNMDTEKLLVLCHACQLRKHVRLLFVSSNTLLTSRFDIVHSDVWTSPILNLSVSHLPKSYRDAFNDSIWKNAMNDEYHALIKNNTWTLVPRPTNANIVRCMWFFRHKHLADGTPSHYKTRLVANSSTQLEGVDVDETFSPVVKLGFFGMFLSQKKFVVEIIERAHMINCNPSRTPIDSESKLGIDGDPVSDPTLCRSLVEAKYRGVANAVAKTCWLRNLLRELHTPLSSVMLVYCDNLSAVYLSFNLYANIFPKGLPSALFEDFRTGLSMRCPPAPITREY
uniref:Ribonuclease H-like domain-containing protein n=1 Tax=Tanacetum cinerariifolium TaxID=118510 RepID=A0A6L2MX43_TANCI|nr:ribonuclease H-like domain-containing protein [Tanacetum cinerariifolium]